MDQERFDQLKAFSFLLPEYISVMIDLMEMLNAKAGQQTTEQLMDEEKLENLLDVQETISTKLIGNTSKTVAFEKQTLSEAGERKEDNINLFSNTSEGNPAETLLKTLDPENEEVRSLLLKQSEKYNEDKGCLPKDENDLISLLSDPNEEIVKDSIQIDTTYLVPEIEMGTPQLVVQSDLHQNSLVTDEEFNSMMGYDNLSSVPVEDLKNAQLKRKDATNCNLNVKDSEKNTTADTDFKDFNKVVNFFSSDEHVDVIEKDAKRVMQFEIELNGYEEENESEEAINIAFPVGKELRYIYDRKPELSKRNNEEIQEQTGVDPDVLREIILSEDTMVEENKRSYFAHEEEKVAHDSQKKEENIKDGSTKKEEIISGGSINEEIPMGIFEHQINLEQQVKEETNISVQEYEAVSPVRDYRTIFIETEKLQESYQHLATVCNTWQNALEHFTKENGAIEKNQRRHIDSTNTDGVSITGFNWLRTYFTVKAIKGVKEDDWRTLFVEGQDEDLGSPVWTLHYERPKKRSLFEWDGFYKGIRTWYFSRRLRAFQKELDAKL